MHSPLRTQALEPCVQNACESRFTIVVLFTTEEATVAALNRAAMFSRGMDAQVRLVRIELVPYPLSFREPPRSTEFAWKSVERIAETAGISTSVELYLCRDQKRALKRLFASPAMLVVGGPERLWRSGEQRLAHWLKRQGHSVVFVPVR